MKIVSSLKISILIFFSTCLFFENSVSYESNTDSYENMVDAHKLTALDLKTLQFIASEGDNKHAIRDVIHYTYFSSEVDARNFVSQISDVGFKDFTGRRIEENSRPIILVTAHHDGTLVKSDIGERLKSIRGLAIKYNGDCDGWEAAIVKE